MAHPSSISVVIVLAAVCVSLPVEGADIPADQNTIEGLLLADGEGMAIFVCIIIAFIIWVSHNKEQYKAKQRLILLRLVAGDESDPVAAEVKKMDQQRVEALHDFSAQPLVRTWIRFGKLCRDRKEHPDTPVCWKCLELVERAQTRHCPRCGVRLDDDDDTEQLVKDVHLVSDHLRARIKQIS